MDTEKSFPHIVYEAIKDRRIRGFTKENMSTNAPSKKIKFNDIMVTLYGSQKPKFVVNFGFVYCRYFKQYFLFVESNPNDYFTRFFVVMHFFLIKENKLLLVNKNNIILGAPVYYPPNDLTAQSYGMASNDSEWYCFKHGMCDYGSEGPTDEGLTVDGLTTISMESSWESFVMMHGIKTSD